MTVYRISNCKYIDDLSGTGAATYGARWNSKGTHLLYTASSPSLSMLESVVHISNITFDLYCMIVLELPEDKLQEMPIEKLPSNWQQFPPPDILKQVGDFLVSKGIYLALKIPSVIVPEDFNVLVNPAHKDFKKIKVLAKRKVLFDNRLFKHADN